MKKLIFFTLFILSFACRNICIADDKVNKSFSKHVGFNMHVAQYKTLGADVFVGTKLPRRSQKYTLNGGLNYFQNFTSFDGVKNLKFSTYGLYVEGSRNVSEYFFLGTRIGLNLSFVDAESRLKYTKLTSKDPPSYFTGIAAWVQGGYINKIAQSLDLKILAQFGLHNFKITTGGIIFSSDNNHPNLDPNYILESKNLPLYSIGIGLIYHLNIQKNKNTL